MFLLYFRDFTAYFCHFSEYFPSYSSILLVFAHFISAFPLCFQWYLSTCAFAIHKAAWHSGINAGLYHPHFARRKLLLRPFSPHLQHNRKKNVHFLASFFIECIVFAFSAPFFKNMFFVKNKVAIALFHMKHFFHSASTVALSLFLARINRITASFFARFCLLRRRMFLFLRSILPQCGSFAFAAQVFAIKSREGKLARIAICHPFAPQGILPSTPKLLFAVCAHAAACFPLFRHSRFLSFISPCFFCVITAQFLLFACRSP